MRVAPTLVTARLVLRQLSMADTEALIAGLMSDPAVMARLPVQPAGREAELEAALDYITALTEPWAGAGHGGWAVCLRSPGVNPAGELIGYCGFFVPDTALPEPGLGPELGYALARAHWGCGYATEAAAAALAGLFDIGRVERVFATCLPDHVASRRVLEKIGMRYRGGADLYDSVAKGLGPMPLYTLTREEHAARVEGG